MGRADFYLEGSWNALCSMCGKKFKADQLVRNWQGMWRCRSCNEPRHPQDFVKAVPDNQAAPWVQTRPAPSFLHFCTPNGRTALSNFAIADCAVTDSVDPMFDSSVEDDE